LGNELYFAREALFGGSGGAGVNRTYMLTNPELSQARQEQAQHLQLGLVAVPIDDVQDGRHF
jgi:hypothetical protein